MPRHIWDEHVGSKLNGKVSELLHSTLGLTSETASG